MRRAFFVLCAVAVLQCPARAERAITASAPGSSREAAVLTLTPHLLTQNGALSKLSVGAPSGIRAVAVPSSGSSLTRTDLVDASGHRLATIRRPASLEVELPTDRGAVREDEVQARAAANSGPPSASITWRDANGIETTVEAYGDAELVIAGDEEPLAMPGAPAASPALGAPTTAAPTFEFALQPAQPNPFSRTTAARFTLPKPGHVQLALYDVAGRKVMNLLDEARPAGPHRVELSGRALSGGRYFLRLAYTDPVSKVTRTANQAIVRLK